MFWNHFKDLAWWAIALSMGINLILVTGVVILTGFFPESTGRIVLGFLFIYIFIAQTLKDIVITRIASYYGQNNAFHWPSIEKRADRLNGILGVINFLLWLIRFWKISNARLVVFETEPYVYFLKKQGKTRKVKLNDPQIGQQQDVLNSIHKTTPVHNLPDFLKVELQKKRVKSIIPIHFRQSLIAMIGFSHSLSKIQMQICDQLASKLGLAIENDILEKTMPRSELLTKEFRIAEKVDHHLSGETSYRSKHFLIQHLESAWKKKHFSAICAFSESDSKFSTLLLCRLHQGSIRQNALQLFSTQGYFYALRGELDEIANSLNTALVSYENSKILLEGFLVHINDENPEKIKFIHFGSHLAYRDLGGWHWLEDSPPLGDSLTPSRNAIQISTQREIILSIREYPLLVINQVA